MTQAESGFGAFELSSFKLVESIQIELSFKMLSSIRLLHKSKIRNRA